MYRAESKIFSGLHRKIKKPIVSIVIVLKQYNIVECRD